MIYTIFCSINPSMQTLLNFINSNYENVDEVKYCWKASFSHVQIIVLDNFAGSMNFPHTMNLITSCHCYMVDAANNWQIVQLSRIRSFKHCRFGPGHVKNDSSPGISFYSHVSFWWFINPLRQWSTQWVIILLKSDGTYMLDVLAMYRYNGYSLYKKHSIFVYWLMSGWHQHFYQCWPHNNIISYFINSLHLNVIMLVFSCSKGEHEIMLWDIHQNTNI